MTRKISALLIALAVGTGACSKSNGTPADSALAKDLSLAQQQRTQFSIDSAERAGELRVAAQKSATAAAQHSTPAASHAARTHTSAGTVATSTNSGTVVEKHTQRDAAIGAAAGAVIGATTSRNKVKGGVIGGVVGGILGGVIGNNVDKTKKKP